MIISQFSVLDLDILRIVYSDLEMLTLLQSLALSLEFQINGDILWSIQDVLSF